MTNTLKTLMLVVVCITGAAQAALTVTATTQQSGLCDILNPALTVTLTPWDFTGTDYAKLKSIDSITVSLTLLDGDTGPGDFDEFRLTLGLDGYDTGVVLNGFTQEIIVSRTVSGSNRSDALLGDLLADGQLVGSVIDADPAYNPNWIRATAGHLATLRLTGSCAVPAPGALLLGVVGMVTARTLRRRWD